MSIILNCLFAFSTITTFASAEVNDYLSQPYEGCDSKNNFVKTDAPDSIGRSRCVRHTSVDKYVSPPFEGCAGKFGFIKSGAPDNIGRSRCIRLSSVDEYVSPPFEGCATDRGFVASGGNDSIGRTKCIRISQDKTSTRYKLKTLLELEELIFSCEESIQYRNSLREFYVTNTDVLSDDQKTTVRTTLANVGAKFKSECDAKNTTKIEMESRNNIQ